MKERKRERKREIFERGRKRLLDNNSGRMGERDRTIDYLRLIKEWKKERVCLKQDGNERKDKIDR